MLYNFRDQSYTTAVTTSTFPNMHTFLNGPELCFMIRKLFSSCRTSKNITLNEQYTLDGMVCMLLYLLYFQEEKKYHFLSSPLKQDLCNLLQHFPNLCAKADYPMENLEVGEQNDNFIASDERREILHMILNTKNKTMKKEGLV